MALCLAVRTRHVRGMRRIPVSRRSHITGFQTLTVSGLTEHESTLERDFVALTTFRDAAARIISLGVAAKATRRTTRRTNRACELRGIYRPARSVVQG